MTRRQVLQIVESERDAAGGVRALARKWRLSAPYISDVLRGRRDPGPKVLKKLGLRKVPPAPVEPSYVEVSR